MTDQEKQMLEEQLIRKINADPHGFALRLRADLPPATLTEWIDWLKEDHNAQCVADSDAHLAQIIS